MTKCSTSNPFFQGPKSRKIEFNFDDGDISSDGGLLFVKEFDCKLGRPRRVGIFFRFYLQRCFPHAILQSLTESDIILYLIDCQFHKPEKNVTCFSQRTASFIPEHDNIVLQDIHHRHYMVQCKKRENDDSNYHIFFAYLVFGLQNL